MSKLTATTLRDLKHTAVFFPCVYCAYVVYVCVHEHMCTHVCSAKRGRLAYYTELASLWSRAHPVPASPAGGLTVSACNSLAFSCGFWGPSSGPHACLAQQALYGLSSPHSSLLMDFNFKMGLKSCMRKSIKLM